MAAAPSTVAPAVAAQRRPLPPVWPVAALAVAAVLVAAAFAVPHLTAWDVQEGPVPPLSAVWHPRVGPGTVPALLLGLASVSVGARLAAQLPWRWLLAVSAVAGAAWMTALATVDGTSGISGVLGKSTEYLPTARAVTDVHALLRDYISHIPTTAAHPWPVHVAGHPPGAVLFFVLLVRVGLGGNLAAGLVVVALAATVPVAVLVTLRRLGAQDTARRAAPFLVIGPAAIWSAVSADAVFAAVTAWGLCLLACAVTGTGRTRIAAGLGSGVLLGLLPYLSYGLVLAAPLVLAVALLGGGRRVLAWVAGGGLAVVAAFTAGGFSWWRAYPVLDDRYWIGAAHLRPGAYWTWADLALLVLAAGPALATTFAAVTHRLTSGRLLDAERTVVVLVAAAALAVALADLSQMSRAEVERIWLPFVPWLLVGAALLPATWRRWSLAGQVAAALVVQSLFVTRW